MIIGCLLFGMLFGMICAGLSVFAGFGLLTALLVYTLAGILGLFLALMPTLARQWYVTRQSPTLALGA